MPGQDGHEPSAEQHRNTGDGGLSVKDRRKLDAVREVTGKKGMVHRCKAPGLVTSSFSVEVVVLDVITCQDHERVEAKVGVVGQASEARFRIPLVGMIEWATRSGKKAAERAVSILGDDV